MSSTDFLSLVIAILMGSLTAYIAKGRGRSPSIWFFIGMFFGIFGLIALFFFPAIKAEEKTSIVRQVPHAEPSPPVVEAVDPLATREWFYLDSQHKQLGPVPVGTLQELWKDKVVGEGSYVWCEGMENWKKVSDIPLLLSRLTS